MAKKLLLTILIIFFFPLIKQSYCEDLTILSPHWEGFKREFKYGFEKYWEKKTGEKVNVRYLDVGGTAEIMKFIRTEFTSKPNGIGVDLVFGGGTDPFIELKKNNFLIPYKVRDELLEKIAADIHGSPLYDKEYFWYSSDMASFGMLCNSEVLRRLNLKNPSSWSDLASKEFFGLIASGDPRRSGSMHMVYEVILQSYGWENGWKILRDIGKNSKSFSSSSTDAIRNVVVGEAACSFSIDSYAYQAIREFGKESMTYTVPQNYSAIVGDGMGILRGAPNSKLARAFIEFSLSEEAQLLLILEPGTQNGPKEFLLQKLSVIPEIYKKYGEYSSIDFNPFDWTSTFHYQPEIASKRWTIVNDLAGSLIIDRDTPESRSGEVPIDEREAEKLSETWSNSKIRNQVTHGWVENSGSIKYNKGAVIAPLLLIIFSIYRIYKKFIN